MAVVSSTWLTGWAFCLKTGCGSLGVTSWNRTCFGTFIGIPRGSRVGCQETSVVGVGGTVLVLLGPPAVLFIFFLLGTPCSPFSFRTGHIFCLNYVQARVSATRTGFYPVLPLSVYFFLHLERFLLRLFFRLIKGLLHRHSFC